jgi:endoglucanase
MDYRFWTSSDLFTITEKKVEPIDRAIRLGEKFGVHVNLCLHRATCAFWIRWMKS